MKMQNEELKIASKPPLCREEDEQRIYARRRDAERNGAAALSAEHD